MRLIAFMMAILAFGCEGSTELVPLVEGAELVPEPGQEEYVDSLTEAVEARWGWNLEGLEINVWWFDGDPCPGNPKVYGLVEGDRCRAGLAWSCELYVARRERVEWSALGHELGHCWRWAQGLDADSQHTDREWWADMEQLAADT
jgi:hypothetical protein